VGDSRVAEELPFASGNAPVVLVVLASEQLWPNLESVCLYRESLRRLIILHTRDPHRSERPAAALTEVARTVFNVESEKVPIGTQPSDVTAAVAHILQRFQDGPERVVLNATCGTKLMTAGILRWVDAPGTATIYREIEGHWYQLRRDRDGRSIVTQRLDTEKNPTDLLDIRILLQSVWGPTDARVSATDLPDLPVDRIAAALAENARLGKEAWESAFDREAPEYLLRRERPSDPGGLFEAFVAGCVRKLGVTNGVMNAVLVRSDGLYLQELDVVANAGGRVVVFDCKTGHPEGELRLVREAAQIREQVGGLAGECVILRPDKHASPQLLPLWEALGVRFVSRDGMGHLCRILADCLRIPELPTVAIETDAHLARWNQRRP